MSYQKWVRTEDANPALKRKKLFEGTSDEKEILISDQVLVLTDDEQWPIKVATFEYDSGLKGQWRSETDDGFTVTCWMQVPAFPTKSKQNVIKKEHLITCKFCGKVKPHYALGLCRNCWARAWKNGGDPAYKPKKIKWGYEQSWQERFVQNVLPDMQFVKPKDFDETVEKVINYLLHERAAKIVIKRSKGNTLEEIGTDYDITRERVRQITVYGYRKVRQFYCETDYDFILGEEEKRKVKERLINESAEVAAGETDVERINALLIRCQELLQSIKIEDLDLNVRSYHYIKRCSVDTLKDLFVAFISESEEMKICDFGEWLLTIRNIGRKSAEHICIKICEKLKKFNVELSIT